MVFRLLRASLPLTIHRLSESIMDGVVAPITHGKGNLASVRQPLALESRLPSTAESAVIW